MSEMEEKLGSILSNPQMMQQILSMAQAMNQSAPPQPPPSPQPPPVSPLPSLPNLDPGMLQALSGLAGQSGMDANQQSLLKALGPYISRQRIHKLEKAMRAAKMARMASAFLNAGGLQMLAGR